MIYHNRAIHKKEMYLYGKRNTQFSFWKDNLTIYCLIFSTYFEIPFMKLYYESHYYDKKTTLAIPISYMSTKFSCYFFLIQTIHRWWDLEKIIQLIWSKKKKGGKVDVPRILIWHMKAFKKSKTFVTAFWFDW